MPKYSREDFMDVLTLEEIERVTGVPAPERPEAEAEREYREMAWENVQVDVQSRDSLMPIDGDVEDETG